MTDIPIDEELFGDQQQTDDTTPSNAGMKNKKAVVQRQKRTKVSQAKDSKEIDNDNDNEDEEEHKSANARANHKRKKTTMASDNTDGKKAAGRTAKSSSGGPAAASVSAANDAIAKGTTMITKHPANQLPKFWAVTHIPWDKIVVLDGRKLEGKPAYFAGLRVMSAPPKYKIRIYKMKAYLPFGVNLPYQDGQGKHNLVMALDTKEEEESLRHGDRVLEPATRESFAKPNLKLKGVASYPWNSFVKDPKDDTSGFRGTWKMQCAVKKDSDEFENMICKTQDNQPMEIGGWKEFVAKGHTADVIGQLSSVYCVASKIGPCIKARLYRPNEIEDEELDFPDDEDDELEGDTDQEPDLGTKDAGISKVKQQPTNALDGSSDNEPKPESTLSASSSSSSSSAGRKRTRQSTDPEESETDSEKRQKTDKDNDKPTEAPTET